MASSATPHRPVIYHHAAHPLDPGMSLEALRASLGLSGSGGRPGGPGRSPPAAVIDMVLDLGVRKQLLEVAAGVARRQQERQRPAVWVQLRGRREGPFSLVVLSRIEQTDAPAELLLSLVIALQQL